MTLEWPRPLIPIFAPLAVMGLLSIISTATFAQIVDRGSQVMIIDTGWRTESTLGRSKLIERLYDARLLATVRVPSVYATPTNQSDTQSILESNTTLPLAWQGQMPEHSIEVANIFATTDSEYMVNHRIVPVLDPLIQFTFAASRRKGFSDVNEARAFFEASVASIDQIIKKQKIKVVIRSMGGRSDVPEDLCKLLIRSAIDCRRQLVELFQRGLLRLVTENRQTAFLLAAPNEPREMDSTGDVESLMYRSRNVLVVSSLGADGNLDEFSAWHPEIVGVATNGHTVLTSDGRTTASGNSFATPRVGAELNKFIRLNPNLDAGEQINRFLRLKTERLPGLAGKVRGGRGLLNYERSCDEKYLIRAN